jgi:choline dehydrogenase
VVDSFHYVVVGGGTAGCVVATRLAEDPEVSVLLIEAGGDERRGDVETPAEWPNVLGTDADWAFETVVQSATGRAYPAPRGKVLGGSGSINNMVHLRGHASDFDDWAAAGGAPGWDYRAVLPYFKRSEDVPDGDPRYSGGPLHPRPLGQTDPVAVSFIDGAKRAGHPVVDDFNAENMLGAGYADALIFNEKRESTASTHLRSAIDRPNLTVVTQALVRRLSLKSGRCTHVEYVRDGAVALAQAVEEVVLCAGAVGSPHLLMVSGLGPARDLAALGITPVLDLPEVGHNLQDHLLLGVRFQAERPVPYSNLAGATVLATNKAGEHGPDLHVTVAAADYYLDWQEPLPNSFTFAVGHMRPKSRGTVRLASSDPSVAPIIDPRYLSESYDLDQLIAGIDLVDQIVGTGAFDDWGGGSETTRVLTLDRVELERTVRDGIGSYSHLAGTCRMGSDVGAVVDPQLRVMGIEGLRVADASVMPTAVTCNTNAATVMIGEKAAGLLRSS